MTHQQSNRTATCKHCGVSGLRWSWRRSHGVSALVGPNGGWHDETCEGMDLKPAACHYCKRDDLYYKQVKKGKFEMVEEYGLQHICAEYVRFQQDFKEAKRIDYALEKQWVKSQLNTICAKCNGKGAIQRIIRRRETKALSSLGMNLTYKYSFCKKCKKIGTFSEYNIGRYLKDLRRKYWPYRPWMKW